MKKTICAQPEEPARPKALEARSRRARNRFLRQRSDTGRILEDAMRPDVLLVQLVEDHRLQDLESVANRSPESDLRGFVEVARTDRHFADAHSLGDTLRDDLG